MALNFSAETPYVCFVVQQPEAVQGPIEHWYVHWPPATPRQKLWAVIAIQVMCNSAVCIFHLSAFYNRSVGFVARMWSLPGFFRRVTFRCCALSATTYTTVRVDDDNHNEMEGISRTVNNTLRASSRDLKLLIGVFDRILIVIGLSIIDVLQYRRPKYTAYTVLQLISPKWSQRKMCNEKNTWRTNEPASCAALPD